MSDEKRNELSQGEMEKAAGGTDRTFASQSRSSAERVDVQKAGRGEPDELQRREYEEVSGGLSGASATRKDAGGSGPADLEGASKSRKRFVIDHGDELDPEAISKVSAGYGGVSASRREVDLDDPDVDPIGGSSSGADDGLGGAGKARRGPGPRPKA